ncbi:MAG TPA: DUF4037 domain-containing protein [Capsulimonadaceae bacterium]
MATYELSDICEEFSKVIVQFAGPGRVATAISGSVGKKKADSSSDLDFRLYADTFVTRNWEKAPAWGPFQELTRKWESRGYKHDGYWPRTIADMDAALAPWLAGKGEPELLEWSVWGYHLPTDLANQHAIYDPDGVIAGWHSLLRDYPPALKAATLKKHLEFLRYWRDDYHYASKVKRGDHVFLAGLSAKIVHSLCQILFALNEVYYPGDGWNLEFIASFSIRPADFAERVVACLYPALDGPYLIKQREDLIGLIDEVEALATS